jgi:hypothetical protein
MYRQYKPYTLRSTLSLPKYFLEQNILITGKSYLLFYSSSKRGSLSDLRLILRMGAVVLYRLFG